MTPQTIDIDGARRLGAAVIEQAIHDHRALSAKGYIVGGKVLLQQPDQMRPEFERQMRKQKVRGNHVTRKACFELLEFFQPGGTMERWISLAKLDIDPDMIRSRLGIPEAVLTKQ